MKRFFPPVVILWAFLGLIYVLIGSCGAARAEETPDTWSSVITPEAVTSTFTSFSDGLGPALEIVEAAGLHDGVSICRAVGVHEYSGVWHQGCTWTFYTDLEGE